MAVMDMPVSEAGNKVGWGLGGWDMRLPDWGLASQQVYQQVL
jgi:hypothetical protein